MKMNTDIVFDDSHPSNYRRPSHFHSIQGETCAVIGTNAKARVLAKRLSAAGAHVTILSKDIAAALAIRQEVHAEAALKISSELQKPFDLAINCIPHRKGKGYCPIAPITFKRIEAIADINRLGKEDTCFLRQGRKAGCVVFAINY
jgi:hypothetical protein